jgi:predicted NAD/FAD-dependent oxidoreductase
MRYIESRGASTRLGSSVRNIALKDDRVVVTTGSGQERFTAAIVAVGPHQLASTVGAGAVATSPWRSALKEVAAFSYESITTVYLAYSAVVPLPFCFARLDDAPGQWVFDRSAALRACPRTDAPTLLAVVMSGSGDHDQQDHRALATLVDAQLRRLAGAMPALLWSRVIAERRATYACTPALPRPSAGRVAPALYLAGDYTDADLPPTLEAATRSGVIAAKALLTDLRAEEA